jgi:hypothetical protein
MSTQTPRIWTDPLAARAYLETPAGGHIPLDTPAWTAWLETPTTTSFAYPIYDAACGYSVGVMTVRKERRQRGGCYWSAYRRRHGRLGKVYLGTSAVLTRQRLEEVAHTFLQEAVPSPPPAPLTGSAMPPEGTVATACCASIPGPDTSASLEATTRQAHSMDAAVRGR